MESYKCSTLIKVSLVQRPTPYNSHPFSENLISYLFNQTKFCPHGTRFSLKRIMKSSRGFTFHSYKGGLTKLIFHKTLYAHTYFYRELMFLYFNF